MPLVTLGKTGIVTEKNGFGALPVQRVSQEDAVNLLRRAFEGGMTFFDTARAYTNSEIKIGKAFYGIREQLYIASKSQCKDVESFWRDLHTTLYHLKTDYLDIYQFHNPSFCPKPGDGTGLYEAMLKAKEQGKIRHIGITNHRLAVANESVESGLYETVQFPFCYLASEGEMALVQKCKERNVGFIAMKGLSGGLITNSAAAYVFEAQFDNVLPIWGIQREQELDEFLSYIHTPPTITPQLYEIIKKDRQDLTGKFCRACGYCMPCPVGIEINLCARMSLLLRRAPSAAYLSQQIQGKMMQVENCLDCGRCKSKCPYQLDTPALLRKNLEDYIRVLSGERTV